MQIVGIANEGQPGVVNRVADYQPARSWRTWLIGRPLATAEAPDQAINKVVGLAVFSSDPMSSVAYAPQELMLILSLAGAGALHLAVPLAMAIVGLLVILTLSYEQTIHAYPGGGGAYIVARDNLGELPAQVAGAALLTDYILTVAVSISAGVAQIVSAFPQLAAYRVEISVAMVIFVMVINLRGVKESGAVFAVPTYFFLLMAFLTAGLGLFRFASGSLAPLSNPPPHDPGYGTQALTLFLVLRAFASGTTALTGVEAISNGITAFREPRSHNAGRTLLVMSAILGSLMLSITFLANEIGAVPTEGGETVISTACTHGFCRPRGAVPRDARCDHPDPAHGCKYCLRRFPPAGCPACGRRFFAPAVDIQRQPAGLLAASSCLPSLPPGSSSFSRRTSAS